ncbi:hypothetical protein G5714_023989 [Onychostoma macrolepis]|uniref:VWFD domain-containing protein n=1 Tax=Onychostoma macrolepis TaxID=369639 RepID=A0A7J6BJQ2_9TELE|nr:hypothetical protein G5714_023989 [Onychostoma macrolepis]
MVIVSMGVVMMSQMWMLRWVVLLMGLQLTQADNVEGHTVTVFPRIITTVVPNPDHQFTICSTWGNFHFKTFDGHFFQVPDTCNYIVAGLCNSKDHSDFNIEIQRKIVNNSVTFSKITVKLLETVIELTNNNILMDKEVLYNATHKNGITVKLSASGVKIFNNHGVNVFWEKDQSLLIELPEKYRSQTCGLCGNYNGNKTDDSFNNDMATWKVNQLEDCEDNTFNSNDQCQNQTNICQQYLRSPGFNDCYRVMDMSSFEKACEDDLCRCYGNQDCLCNTLTEISRQCTHAGGKPETWRTEQLCPKTCPLKMQYLECGSPCKNTCSGPDAGKLCKEHCVDGCFCPIGMVEDDIGQSGCVPVNECPCVHDGKVYQSGVSYKQACKQCVCAAGRWTCTYLECPGICSVVGGSHITTYDGKTFTFSGNCDYILTKHSNDSDIAVLGNLAQCDWARSDTCLNSVTLVISGTTVRTGFKHWISFSSNGVVTLNENRLYKLPATTGPVSIFQPSSSFIIADMKSLRLEIQLAPVMQLYIVASTDEKGKMSGICGNFNKVLADDLKTPQGVVEGTAVSFANAWKAQSNCPDRTERLDDPCSYSSDSEHFAEHWCSKMKDKESLFAKCHTTVNPDSYYKRCKYSSCTCEKSEDCLCTVFSAYARACAAKGIILQGWRDIVCKKYTENCPASQNYSYELQNCQRTCLSLASERQSCSVDFVPVDGCACPEGLYQDENDLCVAMEKCPCYHNGQKIHPGKSVTIRDEHCVCMNGKLHCRSWKTRILGCSSPKVFFNCSTAAPDEHGLECAKTCSQQEVDCFSLDCQSGCQCPFGLLDDGRGHCVKPDYCPCKHDGQYYAPGSEITMDCNQCTCKRGKWKCTHYKCPGICTIYGSGHYITFDQQRFGFRGDCRYIAAQNKCGNKTGNFHVITENLPCGTTGTTCTKAVKIYLGRFVLELSDGNVIANDTGSDPEIKYTVRNVGMYLVIDANIGLTILWDRKTTVRIILQPQHMGEVCGLCGNFNGNGKDDFTTKGNLPTSNILEFVDSWKVGNCLDAKPDYNPCMYTPNRETWAKIQCSIIKDIDGPFKVCHNKVDPNPYYENCVKDSCACDTGGDCECFCTAVAAYAQACNEADVCVNWRTPEICPVYCDYYNNGTEDCTWHYSPCHTPCYKTCLNLNGTCSNNNLPNLEGELTSGAR